MNLPIRILCRTDIDWGSAARDETADRRDEIPARRLPRPSSATPGLSSFLESLDRAHILDLWDETFAVDFGWYRSELNRISSENLASVRDARFTAGFTDFSAWYQTDEDEMIYPIDDDDYFHPELARTAPSAADQTAIVFWPHLVYTYEDNGSPTLATRPVRTLLSNNWGVRKSFLKEHFNDQEAQRILINHAFAANEIARRFGIPPSARDENWWDVELRADRARFLSKSYGISLKHVGSLLGLRRALDRDYAGSFARFRLNESADIPSELMWVEPWIRQAERVFHSLRA